MKMQVYSILDAKSGLYAKPFYMINTNMAVRAFGDLCNDKATTISAHPEDYTLYEIGSYEDTTAKLEAITPQPISNAAAQIRYNAQPELPMKLKDGVVSGPVKAKDVETEKVKEALS